MTAKEVTVVAAAEEAIVAVKAKEAIEDKDKSSHQLIGSSNKDEGSDSNSNNISSGGSDEILATASTSFQRRLRRVSGNGSGEAMGQWLENSSEWVHQ